MSVGRQQPKVMRSLRKVEKIAIADIHVVGRHRDRDPSILGVFVKSLSLVGLQSPITVRRDEKLRAEVSPTAVGLVLGYYRGRGRQGAGLGIH